MSGTRARKLTVYQLRIFDTKVRVLFPLLSPSSALLRLIEKSPPKPPYFSQLYIRFYSFSPATLTYRYLLYFDKEKREKKRDVFMLALLAQSRNIGNFHVRLHLIHYYGITQGLRRHLNEKTNDIVDYWYLMLFCTYKFHTVSKIICVRK